MFIGSTQHLNNLTENMFYFSLFEMAILEKVKVVQIIFIS